jgi:hypothetical protein
MERTILRTALDACAALALLGGAVLLPAPASAGERQAYLGDGAPATLQEVRRRIYVVPAYGYDPYYVGPAYYPPPAAYYAPPVAYAPPPVYGYVPPPVYGYVPPVVLWAGTRRRRRRSARRGLCRLLADRLTARWCSPDRRTSCRDWCGICATDHGRRTCRRGWCGTAFHN